LWELEAVEQLALPDPGRGVTADQVTHVQLGHLVVREIESLQPCTLERLDDSRGLLAVVHFDSRENVRLLGVRDAVVELGDVARAQRGAELLEAARALRDGD